MNKGRRLNSWDCFGEEILWGPSKFRRCEHGLSNFKLFPSALPKTVLPKLSDLRKARRAGPFAPSFGHMMNPLCAASWLEQ